MKHLINPFKKSHGRPPVAELTTADLDEIRSRYIATRCTDKSGSMHQAWVDFCEAHPNRFSGLVADHVAITTIPTAARDAMLKCKAVVGAKRGGAARLRHESAFVPGTMRRHHVVQRRLWAGDRASVDDATRNIPCWIPWPWGGCDCSEKYGVRLGRWQTLITHDDASGFVPVVKSVFRFHQSYRATDAAQVIYETERDVLMFDHWSIEGGVWQTGRVLDILAGRFISAKGRPNQKLVENYIGRLWTRMDGQIGDVGRYRGELKANSELYVACRAGRTDPRKHFMPFSQAQDALYGAIQYLSEKRIKSPHYGTWVPKARWESDLKESPRTPRPDSDFLILPVKETRKVVSDSVAITEDGPLGVRMKWIFTADWMHEYRGRRLDVYFDPMSDWPVKGICCEAGSRKPIGEALCINPLGESKDAAIEMVKAVRQTVMAETRILSQIHEEKTHRTLRHPSGAISTTSPVSTVDTITAPPQVIASDRDFTPLPHRDFSDDNPFIAMGSRDRGTPAATPRITRDDLADALSARASRTRGED